ncbi:hypothetical protein AXF42_Ash019833 [Apostasia shenzhenica]|uniref:Cystatin domain-containing protein n=1 Tax=Apostasia shenzhenica TaxID=1088818 RepID=A0A2I0ARE3_9ASPA|nr:hypothetical protein AXF42_Ash019833 [Apostasia shenzhenica]
MASVGRFVLFQAALLLLLLLLLLRYSAAMATPASCIQLLNPQQADVRQKNFAMHLAIRLYNKHRSSILTDPSLMLYSQLKFRYDMWFFVEFVAIQVVDGEHWVVLAQLVVDMMKVPGRPCACELLTPRPFRKLHLIPK